MTGRPAAVCACAALVVLAGCGAGEESGAQAGSRTLDVLAAASLTESFEELAGRFEGDHPGVEVRLVLESSATLANQVVEGAPADVLATADEASMQRVVDAGAADEPVLFASNQLVLVTPADNPARITGIDDLDDPSVSYVVCVGTAPCGSLAERLLTENGVQSEPSSLEVDVKAVLAKVVSDEADAGLVYASDAVAARSEVATWPVPGAAEALTRYPIAVVDQADQPDLAAAWVDFVLAGEAQEVLNRAGFLPPDATGTSGAG